MLRMIMWFVCCGVAAGAASADAPTALPDDWRNIETGWVIPGGAYCDQPYVVRTSDGAWLCVMTTAQGREGSTTQSIMSLRSTDRGRSWSSPLPLEDPDGPEASYAVLLRVPSGRVYCFYNFNTRDVREVKTETGGSFQRVDSLGDYVFRYTDDGGQSWSAQRYTVPVREFACDRANVYGGDVRFFWNVGRPLTVERGEAPMPNWPDPPAAVLTLHKVGAMGEGFFAQSEGAFLKSENILTEHDPGKFVFETLPVGDIGLRAPQGGGRIAEEQSVVQLSDGSLYCVYRTVDGHPACSYSRDGGRTWSAPQYKAYTPGGRRFKHPRAANFVWKCANGHCLFWFHNHGPTAAQRAGGWNPYDDRNPAWICAGREVDSAEGKVLAWSQPEILLYDDDPFTRISYPDLIEEGADFYITETQKSTGRVHRVDRGLLEGLFAHWTCRTVAQKGLLLTLPAAGAGMPTSVAAPRWPAFVIRDARHEDGRGKDLRGGVTIDVWVQPESLAASVPLLDSRGAFGRGIRLSAEPDGSARLTLSDGKTECAWSSDARLLQPGRQTHVVAIVDGGPKIILFVVDGILCDGADQRQFGWGRYSPHLTSVAGDANMRIDPAVKRVRLYGRALRVSEAVGNCHADGDPSASGQ